MLPLNILIPSAWEGYQRQFIDVDGRVIRPSNQDDTVSEGQAYAMLIAVVLDDRETFDQVLNWTRQHLSRSETFGDHLLAWHWEVDKGVTDWNSAADANVDTALALLLAHARWQDEPYRMEALHLLEDILELETEDIAGKRYLLPGNWRLDTEVQPLNPSYFSPAHFRLFYAVTGDERWKELLHNTYTLLSQLSLRKTFPVRAGLVPDWIGVDLKGNLRRVEGFSQETTWDAVRMPWRVALDVLWSEDACGLDYVRNIVDFWEQEWDRRTGRFFLEYRLEGEPLQTKEYVGAYAMALPALQSVESPITSEVMQKVQRFFHEDGQYFQYAQEYYQHSLSLLGLISLQPSGSSNIPSLVQELQKFSLDDRETCTNHPHS
jgi:endoglucanase